MRVVAIALDLSRSANVLPVTFGNAVGVTVGNSGLLQVRESCRQRAEFVELSL